MKGGEERGLGGGSPSWGRGGAAACVGTPGWEAAGSAEARRGHGVA